jgi:putative Mg2+ transporter-C (MgtC) family protein
MGSSLLDFYVWLDYIIRITIAMVLSGVVGYERQRSRKPAGLRTHMLVCLGSLIFTLLGFDLLAREGSASLRVDPLRIVEAIVGGLGFLGAGAIIQARGSVHGLTTATSIWTMGALGVAVGIGNYPIAVLTTLFSLLVLSIIDRFEKRFMSDESGEDSDRSAPEKGP